MGTPVAGPGPFARRTDKQPVREMPASEYGERQSTSQLQGAAPMAASPGGPQMSFDQLFGAASDRVVPFGEESQLPETPVTDGAAEGEGAGTEILSSSQKKAQNNQNKAYMVALEWMANRNPSDSARNLIRKMKGELR
jgi:hypothetical protein